MSRGRSKAPAKGASGRAPGGSQAPGGSEAAAGDVAAGGSETAAGGSETAAADMAPGAKADAAGEGEAAGGKTSGEAERVPEIRAAGGAVWRRRRGRQLEVVLVHRPRYNDWTLPKGKVDPGETDEEAAVREVAEEASVTVEMGPELPATWYTDQRGRQKLVRYWAMQVVTGRPEGAHEVDKARWFRLDAARRRLSYQRDQAVLDGLATLVAAQRE